MTVEMLKSSQKSLSPIGKYIKYRLRSLNLGTCIIYLIAQDLIFSPESLPLNIISQIQLLAKKKKMVLHFLIQLRIMTHSNRNQITKHLEDSHTVRQKPPVQFLMLDQLL